jgi:hypothetical protein
VNISPPRPDALRVCRSVGFLVALALAPTSAGAQLAHYWGDHFGNESVLLNGAVIGSVTDAGAVFYNPARLIHQEAPSFVASAKLYEWSSVRVKDGLGEGRDIDQSRFGGAPGFLVGTFTLPFLEDHHFAYGIMTRHRANVGFLLREEEVGDVVPSLPGDDAFVGTVDFQTNFRDDWMGLSWAYALGEDVSVGATAFYFERSFTRLASLDLQAIGADLDVAALEVERSYSVRDRGLVGKLGAAWRRGAWSVGVTTTLPYWTLSSKGSIRYENFGVGLSDSDGTPVDNFLESTVQGGRPMEWKTPWAFGGGAGWSTGAWQFHVSSEYYAAVPPHLLVESSDTVLGQSTGEPIDYSVIEERAAVLNGGAGVRWTGPNELSAFASVVANQSAAPDSVVRFTELQPTVSHTSQQMDFVLFGGGVSFHTKWADLTLGATWQASTERQPRATSDAIRSRGVDDEEFSTLKIDEWRFLLGFSIPFVDSLPGIGTGG